MKSQKKATTREKAVIVYSLLFPEVSREELHRAAYDGSDEEYQKLKTKDTQSAHWLRSKKISSCMDEAREGLKRLGLCNL